MAIDKIQSESINLADNFSFTGTVTGAGGDNKPTFFAYRSSNQSINDDTATRINFDAELFDSDCILSIAIIYFPYSIILYAPKKLNCGSPVFPATAIVDPLV